MRYRQPGLDDMAGGEWRSDTTEIRAMVTALRDLSAQAGNRPP
jgi:hypothetical protein